MNNLNYKGNYKKYDSRGYNVDYKRNDVVEYEGKQYISLANNPKNNPNKNATEWKLLSGVESNFYHTAEKPLSANPGDRWIDTLTGKMYTYVEDSNGFHWVEF